MLSAPGAGGNHLLPRERKWLGTIKPRPGLDFPGEHVAGMKTGLALGMLVAGIIALNFVPAAEAACNVNVQGSCTGSCIANVLADCSGVCAANVALATCYGTCTVNGVLATCAQGSCLANAVSATCYSSCTVNALATCARPCTVSVTRCVL